MRKPILFLMVTAVVGLLISCNMGFTEGGNRGGPRRNLDRSSRGTIDTAEYIDFSVARYNANMFTREQVLQIIGGRTFRNGDSWIRINTIEGSIEMSSPNAFFEGRIGNQFYAKFSLDVQAASSDCLYLKRNLSLPGIMNVGSQRFENDAIPDLAVCLPLFGISSNRVEVSPVMNGFIAMPSGTYWRER
jgi:hypothetical protein